MTRNKEKKRLWPNPIQARAGTLWPFTKITAYLQNGLEFQAYGVRKLTSEEAAMLHTDEREVTGKDI